MAHYCTTKAALIGPSRGLAESLAVSSLASSPACRTNAERTQAARSRGWSMSAARSVEELEEQIFAGLPC
jgi:NAD(P)-dependent dehydrogenase (short-subunit alcohol dehydrogenase family)